MLGLQLSDLCYRVPTGGRDKGQSPFGPQPPYGGGLGVGGAGGGGWNAGKLTAGYLKTCTFGQ